MLRYLFYLLIVKPILLIVLGINVRNKQHLPQQGQAIIVANHNSHLDAMALLSLYPLDMLHRVYPVAAADYFLSNRWLKWFALNVVGIIPLNRTPQYKGEHPLAGILTALAQDKILILFPEGSRGQPESLGQFKKGIAHIVSERPDVPVIPVFFHGLGKSLPKGEFVLVPFFIDAYVGTALQYNQDKTQFMQQLETAFSELQAQHTANL